MSDQTEKTYAIDGMTCEHCELSVTEEVEALPGVEWARADRADGRLAVRGAAIDDAAVREAVEAAGYGIAVGGAPASADTLDVGPRVEDEGRAEAVR